ncbi:MAG: type II toxin-antitoxin system VapC family toxin [Acidobacteria bacterium]|nr:type II toxin-antitoxin system VapC family toxin [Acidobacteriota bacterium]
MRLLLDTHAFLWFVLDDPSLSAQARNLIADESNEIEISPATYWEVAIKIGIGKYSLVEPLSDFFERELDANEFRVLPIEPRHVAPLTSLPFHHRDPFDRLIIAQAMVEGISIVSIDAAFDPYPVKRLW